ncbi:MAG: ATP-binding protein [Chloroflexi bacterium]|nr:ATP-binding protein [Chloroflexota bacterium]
MENQNGESAAPAGAPRVPAGAIEELDAGLRAVVDDGSVARTMFDRRDADDGTVTIVIPRSKIEQVPSQALVEIDSIEDGRTYVGSVIEGPFAEPDGLRPDAPVLVTSAANNTVFMPSFHGRAQIRLLGERSARGLVPPRRRPRPNSPVRLLGPVDAAELLNSVGEIRLGLLDGMEEVEVKFPMKKSVLPRHVGILGTTGGGKSTTVAGLISQLQRAGAACVVIDTEGEYTAINEATDDGGMRSALEDRGLKPAGLKDTRLLFLHGREAANPNHPSQTQFRLDFSALSPFAVAELLDLTDAQEDRFFKAYDACKSVLRAIKIFPNGPAEDREALELDEMEQGYPKMTLMHLIDIAGGILDQCVEKKEPEFRIAAFRNAAGQVKQQLAQVNTNHPLSWRALLGKLWRVQRLGVFDSDGAESIHYRTMLEPGRVTIVDLSDSNFPRVNNLTIAQLLRGLHGAQDVAYQDAVRHSRKPTPLVLVIEEAHEFLSAERIKQMPVLFQQVAGIARRGRKRWFGLIFVTQLPQHLPDEALGLVNSWVLHKIADAGVISRLRRSIGGVDDGLWSRLPNLAPGQAVVSVAGHTRPMLVSIDPTPARLRLID